MAGASLAVPGVVSWTGRLGDHQVKLTRSLRPDRWIAEAEGPGRDERTRQALVEAAALVAYDRSPAGSQAIARAIGRDPHSASRGYVPRSRA